MSDIIVVDEPKPFFIRVLARIATSIHFFEASLFCLVSRPPADRTRQSIGALFFFWLCPSLAPSPAMHQYIATMPSPHRSRHHSHRHACTHRRHTSHGGATSSGPPFATSTACDSPLHLHREAVPLMDMTTYKHYRVDHMQDDAYDGGVDPLALKTALSYEIDRGSVLVDSDAASLVTVETSISLNLELDSRGH